MASVIKQIPYNEYTANGVATVYPFEFELLQAADLVVSFDGVAQPASIFTLAGVGVQEGGTVTFDTAPTAGVKVLLERRIKLERTTDYQTNGDLRAPVLNLDFKRLWQALQQQGAGQESALRAPFPEVLDQLPSALDRRGLQLLFHPTTGQPYLAAPVSGSAADVMLQFAGITGSTLVGFLQSGTGAVPRTVDGKIREISVSAFDFMTAAQVAAVQSNDYSVVTPSQITAAVQAACTAAAGRPFHLPRGTWKLTESIKYEPGSYVGVFGSGIHIWGDGEGLTVIDNQADGPAFRLTTASTISQFRGALGAVVEGMTFKRSVSTTGGVAIFISAAYNLQIRHVHIDGMSLHGIQIPCELGDNDGSNMLAMDHVRIENCAGWGIKADGSAGKNETSFMRLQHVFIQACGTNDAATQPPSGGISWKGQILTLDQCAFTLNENCALWIPGDAGLGQTVDLQGTTFEHNKKRAIYCRGISLFRARNIQLYNNNGFIATNAVEFDGADYVVRQVDIDGVVVRATVNNNAYTAFKISGANADLNTCRVKRVVWDDFDYAGQTRFDGWQFDHVMPMCDVVALSSTSCRLRPNQSRPRGNTMPLRLRGGNGGTPSISGEWVAYQVPGAGLAIDNSGLANSTRYYVYLYDNSGAVALELSTTAFDYCPNTGYAIKTGDATRTYCGSVITDGSGQFSLTAGGWLNPLQVPGTQVGAYGSVWLDSTGDLRVRYPNIPTSDTDGTVAGTQT